MSEKVAANTVAFSKFQKKERKKMAFQFMNSIYEKAKKNVKTIAIPEVTNEYMIKAAAKATADGIANIILVGNPEDVTATAGKAGDGCVRNPCGRCE